MTHTIDIVKKVEERAIVLAKLRLVTSDIENGWSTQMDWSYGLTLVNEADGDVGHSYEYTRDADSGQGSNTFKWADLEDANTFNDKVLLEKERAKMATEAKEEADKFKAEYFKKRGDVETMRRIANEQGYTLVKQ